MFIWHFNYFSVLQKHIYEFKEACWRIRNNSTYSIFWLGNRNHDGYVAQPHWSGNRTERAADFQIYVTMWSLSSKMTHGYSPPGVLITKPENKSSTFLKPK